MWPEPALHAAPNQSAPISQKSQLFLPKYIYFVPHPRYLHSVADISSCGYFCMQVTVITTSDGLVTKKWVSDKEIVDFMNKMYALYGVIYILTCPL